MKNENILSVLDRRRFRGLAGNINCVFQNTWERRSSAYLGQISNLLPDDDTVYCLRRTSDCRMPYCHINCRGDKRFTQENFEQPAHTMSFGHVA